MFRHTSEHDKKPYAIVVPVYDTLPDDFEYMGDRVYEELCKKPNGKDFAKIKADIYCFETTSGKAKLMDSVRGKKIFVIHPYYRPHDTHIMTALRIADAAKTSQATETVLVEPYNKSWRQDKRKGRESLDARIVASVYTGAGVDSVITFDPHVDQVQMAFPSQQPLEAFHLTGHLAQYTKNKYLNSTENLTVISPDQGATGRANRMADLLHVHMGTFIKERFDRARKTRTRLLADYADMEQGKNDINGKTCLLVDDVIVSAGSITDAAEKLKEAGAKEVLLCASHLDITDKAYERLAPYQVIGTNTVPPRKLGTAYDYTLLDNFHIWEIEPLIADIVYDHAHGRSLSRHFLDALD